jgi:tetrahedral aminopeptidase
MNIDLLRRLSEARGVPGQEDEIRQIVADELRDLCDLRVDAMGNLICTKKPTKGSVGPKVMIAAHMDEIGFVVKYIEDKGFLRLHTLGGFDFRQLASQRVIVNTKNGPIPGLLMMSAKPKHLLGASEPESAKSMDDFFVDIGMSGDDAKAAVEIGDMVTMDRNFQEMGDLVTGKAMDDRLAVFVMIEAVKALGDHACEVVAVATVQEEIGLRGATASGSAIQPDIVVALDVTLANDIPGLSESLYCTRLGQGTAIKILDSSLICHPLLVKHFRSVAEQYSIPYQMELLTAGGTDAGGVQRLNGGIPAFTLSIPTRYIHTVNETSHKGDIQASIDLLARYLEHAHEGNYAYPTP